MTDSKFEFRLPGKCKTCVLVLMTTARGLDYYHCMKCGYNKTKEDDDK